MNYRYARSATAWVSATGDSGAVEVYSSGAVEVYSSGGRSCTNVTRGARASAALSGRLRASEYVAPACRPIAKD